MSRDRRDYRKAKAQLRKTSAICHICGDTIDRSLPHTDPMAWTADHLVPIAKGGDMLGECLPAHSICNKRRGTKDITTLMPRTRGTRDW